MKLYTWLVDKFVLMFIWLFMAMVGSIAGIYIHAIVMEVFK